MPAALGSPDAGEADSARELLVNIETLREHVWRMLLDWPGFVNLPAYKTALAALLKFDAQFKQLLFEDGEAFKLHSRPRSKPDFNRLRQFLSLSGEAQFSDWIAQNAALPARRHISPRLASERK